VKSESTCIPALDAGEIDHGNEALGENYQRLADKANPASEE
jgi:hypothetical protein